MLANVGSCLVAPDGNWVFQPCGGEDAVLTATIDHARVREEWQNFDPACHYSRPDVLRLNVNRQRQSTVTFNE